jgi:DNA-binding MarR family transcriptional regulator
MNRNDHSISRSIAALYRYRKGYVNKRVDSFGAGGGHFVILLTLIKHNGASQEKISDVLKIDKTTTAKALKKLEDNGYVSRERDEKDRRAYNVYLTPKARDILPFVKETVGSWEREVMAEMTEEEFMLLEKLLGKMVERAAVINNSDE